MGDELDQIEENGEIQNGMAEDFDPEESPIPEESGVQSIWINKGEKIFEKEVGPQVYKKKLDEQQKLFQKGSAKGGVFDGISMSWNTRKLRNLMIEHFKKGRSVGVGASGYGVVEDLTEDEQNILPPNAFFKTGKIFEIRTRHFNFFEPDDDTKLSVRSLALKFGDHDWESDLDMIFHSRSVSPFFNAESMEAFLTQYDKTEEDRKKYLTSLPIYLQAHIEGLRKLPESYHNITYFNPMVYDFNAEDQKKRVIKFRVVPAEELEETGKLAPEDQEKSWKLESPVEENDYEDTYTEDYLRKEFQNRMSDNGAIEYMLQFQIRDHNATDKSVYNPSENWKEEQYPWRNLMKMTLTAVLPEDVIRLTRYNIGSLPETLSIPEAQSKDDFNFVSRVLVNTYEEVSKTLTGKKPTIDIGTTYRGTNETEYVLHIVTGSKKGSGTDAPIWISLIGSTSRTAFVKLEKVVKNSFADGQKYTYYLVDKPIGEFLCAKVYKEPKGVKSDWFLEYIILTTPYNGKSHVLPCNRWFTDEVQTMALRDGHGSLLAEDEHHILQLHRQVEIQNRRRVFKWADGTNEKFQGLPGYIAAGDDIMALPRDVRFEDETKNEVAWNKYASQAEQLLSKMTKTMTKTVSNLKGADLFKVYEVLLDDLAESRPVIQHIIKNWKDDEEFGRQILNGVNPCKVRKLQEIPENFPIDDELLGEFLEPEKTLEEEMQVGNLFLLSYPELANFAETSPEQQRFLCAPICLLYVKADKLVPIAIQLTQEPTENTPIYTPKDSKGTYSDWQMAKMWVRAADTNQHQLSSHFLNTHLSMEPIAISIFRNLPSSHPVFKLLFPSIRYVMAINTLMRKFLMSDEKGAEILAIGDKKGGPLAFIRERYEEFKFNSLCPPDDMDQREVMDENILSAYYYRDDAMKLWYAISDFVSAIVGIYYEGDDNVDQDEELDNVLQDLLGNGYHDSVELIDKFSTKEDLERFLSIIIFTCSVQHTAVNSGQLDYYGYIPNAPPCMMKKPPTTKQKDGLTTEGAEETLTELETSHRYITFVNLLSQNSESDEKLGAYQSKLFTDEAAVEQIRNFQERLKEISKEIKERNKDLACPYEYLLPENISSGITI